MTQRLGNSPSRREPAHAAGLDASSGSGVRHEPGSQLGGTVPERPRSSVRIAGDPVCGICGYALKSLRTACACPECGTPFVDGLVRANTQNMKGFRFRTQATLFGLPLIDIAFGADEKSKFGNARGIIAVGDIARGGIAIGGMAFGAVSYGGLSVGVCSIGGASIGLLTALGGMAVSGGFAVGGGAVGTIAKGGGAVGYIASGGGVVGVHRQGPGAPPDAIFDKLRWLLGSPMDLTTPAINVIVPAVALSVLISIVVIVMHKRFASRTSG